MEEIYHLQTDSGKNQSQQHNYIMIHFGDIHEHNLGMYDEEHIRDLVDILCVFCYPMLISVSMDNTNRYKTHKISISTHGKTFLFWKLGKLEYTNAFLNSLETATQRIEGIGTRDVS